MDEMMQGGDERNMGTVDRMVRASFGLAALVLRGGGLVSESVAFVVVAVAIVFLLTSLWGLCPLYVAFGISTAPKPESGPAAAIGRLFANRKLPVPPSEWTLNNVPVFAELREPCPPKILPRDVRTVFESNCAPSLDRHLPALEWYEGGGS